MSLNHSELAERVKALKAANTIEATPQRVRSKQATAEQPITARIRKRQEANSASDHQVERDVSPELPALQPPPAAGDDSSALQPMTFQERIAMEPKRQDHEPSLPEGQVEAFVGKGHRSPAIRGQDQRPQFLPSPASPSLISVPPPEEKTHP